MSNLPFIDLKSQYQRIKPVVDAGIQAVLDHGQYIMGPEVAAVEETLAAFAGARHCVAVSSGTDALTAPLMAYGIGPGDAVFVPSFTFTATAEVVALLGATPVFVDVEEVSFNIDPDDLEKQIDYVRSADGLTAKCVMGVDLFGAPADYDRLSTICDREGLMLIADGAQSFGAKTGNRRVGTLAPLTSVSFFPAKPLGCYGDGGAIFTDDDDVRLKLDSIRQHGQGTTRYAIDRLGLNARFDSIQAAVILAKMDIFEEELLERQGVAARYNEQLSGVVETPKAPQNTLSAWAQYTIKTDARETLQNALGEAGIPTAIYYPKGMHEQEAYKEFSAGTGHYPITEGLCDRVMSLPMHPYLSESDQTRICDTIRAALRT